MGWTFAGLVEWCSPVIVVLRCPPTGRAIPRSPVQTTGPAHSRLIWWSGRVTVLIGLRGGPAIMDFDADVGEKHVDRRSKHVLLAKVDDQAP
jgi:hypothetical protein